MLLYVDDFVVDPETKVGDAMRMEFGISVVLPQVVEHVPKALNFSEPIHFKEAEAYIKVRVHHKHIFL